MLREHRWEFGVALTTIGLAWFVFDLIWLPPGLIIVGVIFSGYPRWVDEHFRTLWQTEFLASALIGSAGILLMYSANRRASWKAYLVAFASAVLVSLAAFQLFGWFPFST